MNQTKSSYIPQGCDQQGRHPEKSDMAAPPFTPDPLEELEHMNAEVDKDVKLLIKLILIAVVVTCMIVIPAHYYLPSL